MNAFQIPGLQFSGEAGENVLIRRFVSVNTDGKFVNASAGENTIGVSTVEAATGEVLEVNDGIAMVEAGAAVDAGSEVEVGTDGKAITKDSGTSVGIALTKAGADGEMLAVKL